MNTSPVRFGALLFNEPDAWLGMGLPPYTVKVTSNTADYPLDAVVFNNKVIGNNADVETLSKNLGKNPTVDFNSIRTAVKKLVTENAGTWFSVAGAHNAQSFETCATKKIDDEAMLTQNEDGSIKTVQYGDIYPNLI